MTSRLLEALDERVLVIDGAMGTKLMDQGVSVGSGLDYANLDAPGVVQAIHRDYLAAGADILETNTFGANRFRLAKHGLTDKVRRINRQGVMLARSVAGNERFVGGAMGPLGKPLAPIGTVSTDEAREAFHEQASALIEAGVDLILLETFSDLSEIKIALEAVRSIDAELPVAGFLSFTDECKTIYGYKPEECARSLMEGGAQLVGANCSSGPEHLHEVIDRMHRVQDARVLVLPNAGLPAYVDGRYVYLTGPEYFARHAQQFIEQGVRAVGGCCGTNEHHIRSVRAIVGTRAPVAVEDRTKAREISVVESEEPARTDTKQAASGGRFIKKIEEGTFVVSVEIDPPKSVDASKMIRGAAMLKQAGVDAINIADSPLARARMSPLALATLIRQEVPIEIILHMSCRDRNVLGLQAELMGAQALGVMNILAVTGDPPSVGDYPDATGVFEVDAIGLIGIMERLNQGVDLSGKPLKFNTEFVIGCASNPTSDDVDREIERFLRKEEAGVHFTMTQPLYELESLERFLEKTSCGVPVMVGILPLRNGRHAEFLHNEVPGMFIPEDIRARMKAAGDQGPQEGVQIAREFLEQAKPLVQGTYLMPPFNRFEMAVEVIKGLVED
ncbi:MAG: bifunctional homocysteine S-methyltransferase/methylenetetrahydrofolate reductase [Myxococcales bacterium]|nr:bifunctional homocysteine S-methyltransferase/methylenetetrahydrofolate reductase [Myxococcales bacterium]